MVEPGRGRQISIRLSHKSEGLQFYGGQTVKSSGKGTIKFSGRTVKTAEWTARTTVKTTEQAAKATQQASKASVKTAQKAAQVGGLRY